MVRHLIFGGILDTVAAMVITLPFVFPVITDVGYDPVCWEGFIAVISTSSKTSSGLKFSDSILTSSAPSFGLPVLEN